MNQLDPRDVFGRQDRGLPKTSSVIMPLRWTIPSRTVIMAQRYPDSFDGIFSRVRTPCLRFDSLSLPRLV